MKVIKEGSAGAENGAAGELAAVNAFAKTELRPEDVYVFSVLLCDNEVDRDFERFTQKSLEELGELFIGKTGISDHEWKSANQVARIYRTEVLTDAARQTASGEAYTYLKGHAYMLRTEENAGLIAEIGQAVAAGHPLLIGVPRRFVPAWDAFAQGLDEKLPCRRAAIDAWWQRIQAPLAAE